MKTKQYPKTIYIKQTDNNPDECGRTFPTHTFTKTIKNKKEENEFRAQAASMEPNFTNEISEVPFPRE